MGANPIISMTVAMVLAVNCPPQAPAPGQARFSIASKSVSLMLPGGVRAHSFENILDGQVTSLDNALA